MLPVPEASVPAVEICSETSAAANPLESTKFSNVVLAKEYILSKYPDIPKSKLLTQAAIIEAAASKGEVIEFVK